MVQKKDFSFWGGGWGRSMIQLLEFLSRVRNSYPCKGMGKVCVPPRMAYLFIYFYIPMCDVRKDIDYR